MWITHFMHIKEVKAKSILTKTGLPADFVINPYEGCGHGCKYCYAKFMKRFIGTDKSWGDFVNVKINAPDLIPSKPKKFEGKSIIIGSVTDPYQPIEKKYKITRQMLKKLIPLKPKLDIITKSSLITRDIDLLKQFENFTVAISMSPLHNETRKRLEPNSTPPFKRIEALKELHGAGIRTVLFISPIFPELTDWKSLVKKTMGYVDEYWFENLNMYPLVRDEIYKFLQERYPKLKEKYQKIYTKGSNHWLDVEKKIRQFCKKSGVESNIFFHHQR